MDIINRLGAYKIDKNFSDELFDKEHSKFRMLTFISIMKAKKDKYMSMFRFEGDKEFTISKQKTLLRQTFIHGYAGMFDLRKAIESQLGSDQKEFATYVPSNKIALGIAPSHWNEDNEVVKGYGFTTERHNTGIKGYSVDANSTAIVKFDEDGYTGWYKWLPFAYLEATALTVLKKRSATMDKKLVSNSANNSYENADFDDLYSIATTFLKLSPTQNNVLSGKKTTDIDVAKLLNDKLAKVDFTAQETVNDLISFVDANRNMWNYMFGERTNTNKKGERNISDEFTSDEIHFALMELDQKEQMQTFVDKYNMLFGSDIKLICKIDEKMQELLAQERALSGGGADRQGETKDDK